MFEGNKVNPEDIDAVITKKAFLVIPDTTTTLCTLTLDNGFTVRGEASCVDPANYDQAIGEGFALADAKRKIWPLLGFRLADKLAGAVIQEKLSRTAAFETLPDDYETGDH